MQMVNARQGLIDLQTELQNRDAHSAPEVVKRMQARLLKKIAAELAALEVAIAALVKATPRFAELRGDNRERARAWQVRLRPG